MYAQCKQATFPEVIRFAQTFSNLALEPVAKSQRRVPNPVKHVTWSVLQNS